MKYKFHLQLKYYFFFVFCIVIQGFQNLWSDEKLLNIAEQILGPEVAGHPVWNLRPKIPKNEIVVVPWHQGKNYKL